MKSDNNSEEIVFEEKQIKFLIEKGIEYDTIKKIDLSTGKILNLILNLYLEELSSKLKLNTEQVENLQKIKESDDLKTTPEDKNNEKTKKEQIATIIKPEDMELDVIYSNDNYPYIPLGVSHTKILAKGTEKISYLTICSSVASSGRTTQLIDDTPNLDGGDTSGSKAALFGSADDAQNFTKLIMGFGSTYSSVGAYVFSKESLSCVPKEEFLNSLRNFFNSDLSTGSLIYYSGHGFANATILFETSQGNYFISYEDIVSIWKERSYPKSNSHLLLILDCCYSGSWVKKLLENGDWNDFSIQASSTENQTSLDMGSGKGSLYTNAFLYSNILRMKQK